MSFLSATGQQKIEDMLIAHKLLSAADLKKLKNEALQKHIPFMGLLVSEGHVSDEVLAKLTAEVNKTPYVNLSNATIDAKILELLPNDLAERYMAVPLGEMQHRLVVAMLDADNVQAVDFLSNKIGQPLKVYAASESGIRRIIKQYDSNISQSVVGDINTFDTDTKVEAQTAALANPAVQTVTTIVQDSPISKALSAILEFAVKNRASDVHIEPLENAVKVRCRIDGILREIMRLPKSTEPPLVSRIKILSALKIDEHRIPQDGQFTLKIGIKEVDLRVAVSPVVWGEQVVIRLLDKGSLSLKLEDMGYAGRALRTIRDGIKHTSGMVLTSGPTGSGKTTTMYALLQEVKNEGINIVTLEDPVEYKIEGINQIQVNPAVGLTFATGLRSILRQDPDVVMVGEIRDKETAELAVQASLTGHLVLSTLHTNSSAGILPRLLDMEVEPFLIASTVHTVIGQRLVRRIGAKKETYQSNEAETKSIHDEIGSLLPATEADRATVIKDLGFENLPLKSQNAYTLTRGIDGPETPGGYRGRMGIYEAFNVTEEIQKLILKRATSSEIQAAAQKEQGMVSMRQDGYLKTLSGLTTITEVNRVASAGSE
jgi:type IV pilus assembly protein PilB